MIHRKSDFIQEFLDPDGVITADDDAQTIFDGLIECGINPEPITVEDLEEYINTLND